MAEPPAELHPFAAAWQSRDAREWSDALAPDVVVHSPLLEKPFVGREAVGELYAVLFEQFGAVEIGPTFTSEADSTFFWRGVVDGDLVEGVDLVRLNADGQVAEIRVFMRPVLGLGTFAAALAPAMARRDGRTAERLVRLATRPVRPLLRAVDAAATWIAVR
jgi:hypothetical protein